MRLLDNLWTAECAKYLALVRAFPLVSILDDQQLAEALQEVDRLVDLPARSSAQEAYLGALTDLVETYETAHVVIPPLRGGGGAAVSHS